MGEGTLRNVAHYLVLSVLPFACTLSIDQSPLTPRYPKLCGAAGLWVCCTNQSCESAVCAPSASQTTACMCCVVQHVTCLSLSLPCTSVSPGSSHLSLRSIRVAWPFFLCNPMAVIECIDSLLVLSFLWPPYSRSRMC